MRVLLATDGSTYALEAARWLTAFPLPADSSFLVLAVGALPAPVLDVPAGAEVVTAINEAAEAAAADAIEVLRRRWHDVTPCVLTGEPRTAIVANATDWRADLIVVGARGLGAVRRFLLGSVSSAVVNHASCPVLVVRGRGPELTRAIVAIDGSPDSIAAARFLGDLPLDPAMTVRLVGVVEPPGLPLTVSARGRRMLQAAIEQTVAANRTELEKTLAGLASELEIKVATEHAVLVGAPAREILSAAFGADLIVVGARGLGPIDRLLLGSVSERVLAHATCSVLVVKRPR